MYQIVDIFTIFHFISYYIYGLYFKNKYVLTFLIGFLWELCEYVFVNTSYTKDLLIKYLPVSEKYWAEKNIFNKVSDLLINMIGYHLGNISKSKIKLFKK